MKSISRGIRDIDPGVPVIFEQFDEFEMHGIGPFLADEAGVATGYDLPPELDATGFGHRTTNSVIHDALNEIFVDHGLETCDLRAWSYDSGAVRDELCNLDLDDTPENIETVINKIFPDNPKEVTLSMIAYMSSHVRNYPFSTAQKGSIV